MCELLALSSNQPATVSFSLMQFAAHGGFSGPHKDGWGIGYYQMLHLDLYDAGAGLFASMQDESQYTIEGTIEGVIVYRGKFLTTSKDITAYSVNQGKYTQTNSTNNYTILD